MTTMKMKIIVPSAMAALTPAETEAAGDGPIDDTAGELEAFADSLADPGIDNSVFGVETLVLRVERFTGNVVASGGILFFIDTFELRSGIVESVCVADGTASGLLGLDTIRRVPREFRAELDGFVAEMIEVFDIILVPGSSTDEALPIAATAGFEAAATFGM